MRRDVTVAAEPRAARGKNEARRLRQTNRIPAIVYGAYQEPVAVAVSPKELQKILHSSTGHNTIFNVDIAGRESTPVMIVDWQYDPVRDTLLHVDLKRIDLSKRLKVLVPVVTHGEARGVKEQDGLLEVVAREIEIECLPDDIPEHFTVDVSELMLGQAVRAADIAMPEQIKLVSAPENVVAHVVALKVVEEPVAAEVVAEAGPAPEAGEAPAAAEPEVIKKGKKEEEAVEGETPTKKKR